MSNSSDPRPRRVLVIGAQGVLGALLADAFAGAGWHVLRGGRRRDERPDFRHVDLDEAETVVAAGGDADLIVMRCLTASWPPSGWCSSGRHADQPLGAARPRGPRPARRRRRGHPRDRLDERRHRARDHQPGRRRPAGRPPAGRRSGARLHGLDQEHERPAGADFAHRGLTTVARHRTTIVALPEPFGTRRCLGFAEPDAGWLDPLPDGVAVTPYVCVAERSVHRTLLAANATGLMTRLPRAALRSTPVGGEGATREPVAHWIAVFDHGRRIAARTLECRGDYAAAAASTVTCAEALARAGQERAGAFAERMFALDDSLPPSNRRASSCASSPRRERSPRRLDARPVRGIPTART